MYVFPCVILFLCFSVLLVLRLPRLGKRELILVLFVSCSICACLDLSVSSSSWGLGRAAVCDCGTPWTFLLPFFDISCKLSPLETSCMKCQICKKTDLTFHANCLKWRDNFLGEKKKNIINLSSAELAQREVNAKRNMPVLIKIHCRLDQQGLK